MTCPLCGKAASVVHGRCSSCKGALEPANSGQEETGFLPLISSPGELTGPEVTGYQVPPSQPGHRTASDPRAETTPLVPGQAFGARYHVIRMLGAGGMGAVYQAWDEELGVAVAIKVIRPEVLADPEAVEEIERRFKRELLLARQVTHKNVVRIHDLGDIDGIKYITMPYVQGSDLATLLKRHGKLHVGRALMIARQVAGGLVAAHEAGIVHRDLKPENIMIDGDFAMIMDFGIARAMSALDGTVAGVVRGTLGYMAPEQARGAAVDQRVDIYAFGLILYDMLLGRVRHTRNGQTAVAELMDRMQHAPRSAREIDPDIPDEVDLLLSRCVEPDPDRRYQTSAELMAELESLDPEGHRHSGATAGSGSHGRSALSSILTSWAFQPAVQAKLGLAALGVLALVGVVPGSEGARVWLPPQWRRSRQRWQSSRFAMPPATPPSTGWGRAFRICSRRKSASRRRSEPSAQTGCSGC
jgi:serine/threonine protein kinase